MKKYYLHITLAHGLLLIIFIYNNFKKNNFFIKQQCTNEFLYINKINKLFANPQDTKTLIKNLNTISQSRCPFIIAKIQITPSKNKEKVIVKCQF
jgi:hypothetical protein